MIIHCCRNRGWNQKQKHKKTALEQGVESTLAPRIKTARRFTAKTPDDKMISKGGCIKSPKTITP